MSNATIGIDCLQTFQVTLHIPAQIAFNFDLVVGDRVNDFVDLLRRELIGAQIWIDVRLLKNFAGGAETDSVNVGQRRFDALVRWNFNSE